MTVMVCVSLPLLGASPNARVHWGTRKRNVAEMRKEAHVRGLDARNSSGVFRAPMFCGPVSVGYEYFCGPTVEKRVRPKDADNAIACCKPYLDGLRDAGIISDDTVDVVEIQSPVLHRRKKFHRGRACVEITISAR